VKYVNPLSLLSIQPVDIAGLDNTMLKKLRRKLFAEIELSDDGAFHQNGVVYTRSECEKALDSLEDQTNLHHHAYLLNNPPLLAFLNNGDTSIFQAPQLESAYLDNAFQDFVGPFFAPRFDKALLEAFKMDVAESTIGSPRTTLENVLKLSVLIAPSYESIAYRSLMTELQARIDQLEKLAAELKEEESEYDEDNVYELVELTTGLIPVHSLNKLPIIFQSLRNKFASQANSIQHAAFNSFYVAKVSHDILEHVLNLNIDSAGKPIFIKNYNFFKAKYDEQIQLDKYKDVIHKWASYVKELNELIGKVNNKFVKPNNVILNIQLDELNGLESFADEIRDTVAKRVRELSVAVWNSYKDHRKSMQLLQVACSINTTKTVRDQLVEDQNQLAKLRSQSVEVTGTPIESAPNLHLINGCGTTLYDSTLYFVIFGIPILPIARYNYESFGNQYRFYGKLKLRTFQVVWRYLFFAFVAYLVINAIW
jgi:hypothetical protein